MAKEIILPKMGMDMSSGTIIDWFVEEGDAVKKGEPILEVMTDKVSIEVEAEESGVILKILGEVDHEYPVFSVIGYIGEEGEWIPGNESTEAFVDHLEKIGIKSQTEKVVVNEPVQEPVKKEIRPQKIPAKEAPVKSGYELSIDDTLPELENYFQNDYYLEGNHVLHEVSVADKKKLFDEIKSRQMAVEPSNTENLQKVRISPAAKRLMREAGIDLNTVLGSGPKGRIQRSDVEKTISSIKATGTAPVYEAAAVATKLESLVGHPDNRMRKKRILRPKDQSVKEMTEQKMTNESNESKLIRNPKLDFVPFVENGEAKLRDEIIVKPTPIESEAVRVKNDENPPQWEAPQNLKAQPIEEMENNNETVETTLAEKVAFEETIEDSDKTDIKEKLLTTEAEKAEVLKAIEEAQAEKVKMMEAIKAAEAEKEEMIRLLKAEREKSEEQKRMAESEDRAKEVAEARKFAQELIEAKREQVEHEEDELEALVNEARKLARELLAEEKNKALINTSQDVKETQAQMQMDKLEKSINEFVESADIALDHPLVREEHEDDQLIIEKEDHEIQMSQMIGEKLSVNDETTKTAVESSQPEADMILDEIELPPAQSIHPESAEKLIESEIQVEKASISKTQIGAEKPQTAENQRNMPLTGKRKIIAERMLKSHQENAVITLTVEIDMSEIKELRRKITAKVEEQAGFRCTYTDFLLAATARALLKHEMMNCSRIDDQIFFNDQVNIGLAVGQEDGLLVPVIKACQTMNFVEMVKARGETLKKIKSKQYLPEDLKGSTFTITNLGMYGVNSFSAIINQPNAAILSVGEVVFRMRIIHGEPQVRSVMKISLNLDHQVADGMAGAKFLEDVKADMENPSLLLF
ncbi:2-oxo acid dehydrogenase subunit E2 [Eubacteriaceae bacterium ES2]|nr:2-oxo acid dehydrogenase subunit E2 [Eubacteriaceae bacterium ES2]